MITMVDELFDRAYQDNRAKLNHELRIALSGLANELGKAFRALNRSQWQAPWANAGKDAGCA